MSFLKSDKNTRELRPLNELKEKIIERLSGGEEGYIRQGEFNELAGLWKDGKGVLNSIDIIKTLNERRIGQEQIAGFYSRSKSKKVKKLIIALLTFYHRDVQLIYL